MLRKIVPAACLLSLVAVSASAQIRIIGSVRDEDGHPIKGATIVAQNAEVSTITLTSTSDTKGRFGMLGMRSGLYTIVIQAPGYDALKTQATVTFTRSTPIDIKLHRVPEAGPPSPLQNVDANALQQQFDNASKLEADGKLDEAIQIYRQIVARVPALTMVHLQIGALLERRQDAAAALGEYQALLKTDPANEKARAAVERLGGGGAF